MTSIVEKLKKLIAMEKSSRSIGNQAEAEAFALKIASMLRDHKLSMSDVEFEAQAKENPFGSEAFTQAGSTVWLWRIKLANTIAQSLFCQSFYRSGENTIVFAGRETDRAHVIGLYASLVDTAKRLVNVELRKAKKRGQLGISELDWRKSFLLGFAAGIDSRLRVQQT